MNDYLIPRIVLRLSIATSTIGFSQSVFIVLIPIIVAQTGLGSAAVGAVAFAGALAFVAASPLWGLGAPGRHPFRLFAGLVFIGHALFALALLGGPYPAIVALALLGLSRIVYGIGAAGVMPQAQALLLGTLPREAQPAALSRLSAGLGTGRILGSLVTGLGVAGPAVVPLVLLASPALLLLAPSAPLTAPGPRPRGRIALDRAMLPLLAIGLVATVGFGQMQTTLALLFQHRLGLDAAAATSLMAASYALVAVAMIAAQIGLVPRLAFRLRRNLGLGLAGIAAGAALVAATESFPAMTAGLLLAGLGVAVATPAYTTWLAARVGPDARAGAAGWLAAAHAVGQGLGALTGGLAFEAAPALPFLLSSAGALACLVLAAGLREPAPQSA
jgi:MFS family permease